MDGSDRLDPTASVLTMPKTFADKCVASFVVRCRATRGGPWAAETEIEVIRAWVERTLNRCGILNLYATTSDILASGKYDEKWVHDSRRSVSYLSDVVDGTRIVDLMGDSILLLSPNPNEARELAAWGLHPERPRYGV
jgi:hypothetical protein